jgi:hypothetical protein
VDTEITERHRLPFFTEYLPCSTETFPLTLYYHPCQVEGNPYCRVDEAFAAGWKLIVRMRSGVKAIYGGDSSEYEMAGGTRLSERKSRSKRDKARTS